ncbi:MAG: DNA cytosine methyltransferase [Bacteroidota bacterium]
MLSVKETAEIKGVSEQYIRRLIKNNEIPADRVGKTWLIDEAFLDTMENGGEKQQKKLKIDDVVSKKTPSDKKLNVLSFFTGAMGLDLGLEKAGLNVLLACEIDTPIRNTIVSNDTKVGLIGDVRSYTSSEILHYANVKSKKQVDVIVGGPPCQAFSTAGKRMGFEDERGNVFLRFIEVISDIKPKYAVIENVRGLLSSKLTIDIDDDIVKKMDFNPKETPGSTLYYITKKLEKAGYKVTFNLYNTANFGVPQIRERVVIVCTLGAKPVPFLKPTHSENPNHKLKHWVTFKEAVTGMKESDMHYIPFSAKRLKYIEMLKPGQNWRDLPVDIQPEAMGGSFFLGGGKTGFYRRLSWDRPAPTIVTHPAMPATELAHPTKSRPLSVEEYKRVQQFPDNWSIQGSIVEQYRQIGNAVPVGLGKAIGLSIINHSSGKDVKAINDFPYSRYKNTSSENFFSTLYLPPKKERKPTNQLTLQF